MTAKRLRAPKLKDGELRMYWGKPSRHDNPDAVLAWQGDPSLKRDTNLLLSRIDELQAHGYDITTLKFSVQKKVQA